MKNSLIVILLLGFLLIPSVNVYPGNAKNCCVYCTNTSQKLCFWNDNDFLYMSIKPDGIGSFCADVTVQQKDTVYNVKGYGKSDDFICREIDEYLKMRFADGTQEAGSPFDPTRPLTIFIENCDSYLETSSLKYPSACGSAPVTTSSMAKTSTTTTIKITTSSTLPTTTILTSSTTTTSAPTSTSTSTTTSLPTTTTTVLPKKHSISGFLTGDVIADVSVKLTGTVSKTIVTDAKGYYKFSGLERGFYTITPQCEEYDFEPQNYLVQNLTSDLYNMDFMSTELKAAPCPPMAICGDDPEEIELLKYLRDNVLRDSKEGQELIEQWKKIKGKKGKENDG